MGPKIKSLAKRSIRIYVPEIDSWVTSKMLKPTIAKLGYTSPKDWYDNNFLPRDSSGNIIYPKCGWSKCGCLAKFKSPTEGYRNTCEEGGIDHHNKHIAEDENSYCHSDENKKWRSEWMKAQMSDPSSSVCLGRGVEWRLKQSELARKKVADPNCKFGSIYLYPESRFYDKEVVEDRTRRILNAKGGYGIVNYFLSSKMRNLITLRSRLEMHYAEFLNSDESVESFEYEFVGIDYEYKGEPHKYYPDFKVVSSDGTITIVEVKPDYQIEDDLVQAKIKALDKYIVDNDLDWNVVWITELDIKHLRSRSQYYKTLTGEYIHNQAS